MSNVSVSRRLSFASMLAAFGVSLPALSIGTGNTARGRGVHSGGTFNAGRNQEKREARRRERLMRKTEVDAYLSGLPLRTESADGRVITFTGRFPVPKRHMSHLTIDMLANRRLRQRGRA